MEILENGIKMIDKAPILAIPPKAFGDKHFAAEFNKFRMFLLSLADEVNKRALGYTGSLRIADPMPTIPGLYKLMEFGTYANLIPAVDASGNNSSITAVDGKINEAYYDGTKWVNSKITVPGLTASQNFNPTDNVNPSTMKAAADRYDSLINNVKNTLVVNNNQFSSLSQITIAADNVNKRYYTLFTPQSVDCNLKQITIKGKGIIGIYKIKPDGSNETFIKDIDLGNNNDTHTVDVSEQILIEAGYIVGISGKASGTSTFYFQTPKPSSSDLNLIQLPPYEESNNLILAYNYRLESISGGKYYATPEDLQEFKNEVIKPDAVTTQIYYDDFSSQSSDWTAAGWNYTAGKFTSAGTGKNNKLFNSKYYNVNKRRARVVFKPSADTDFRIHLLSNNATNEGEGSSLFSVNFVEKKIKIFNVFSYQGNPEITSDGVLEDSVLKEVPFTFDYVFGRDYLVELSYYETKHVLTLTDTVTTESKTLEFDGWKGGRQQQNYAFWVYSGGSVSISQFEVLGPDKVDTLFVGDSITEGVMVIDKSKRWWKLMQPKIPGISAVSARGGHGQIDVINKFQHEILKIKPKRIVFLIGINSGGDTAQYTTILNLCLDNGIVPSFAYQPAVNFNNSVNANMLSVIPEKYRGFRFDLATSVNHDAVTCKTDLFYDGLHPVEAGCFEMAKRIFDLK